MVLLSLPKPIINERRITDSLEHSKKSYRTVWCAYVEISLVKRFKVKLFYFRLKSFICLCLNGNDLSLMGDGWNLWGNLWPDIIPSNIEKRFIICGKIPIFGICLGYQLLALATGALTYKLKYGHRGANHPVINLENNKVIITSQNHGYAVDLDSIPKIMRPTYKNLNDNTLEGFEISSLGIYAVQFHPEAKPGPDDASIIFDEWINIAQKDINRINEVKNEK